jgi:hypothetical protein
MNRALEVATAAREWLSDPSHWIDGKFINSRGATCLIGAVLKCSGVDLYALETGPEGATKEAVKQIPEGLIPTLEDCATARLEGPPGNIFRTFGFANAIALNDNQGHAAALDVLDCTIGKLREAP